MSVPRLLLFCCSKLTGAPSGLRDGQWAYVDTTMESIHDDAACMWDRDDWDPATNEKGSPAKAMEGGFKGELLEPALVAICWYA